MTSRPPRRAFTRWRLLASISAALLLLGIATALTVRDSPHGLKPRAAADRPELQVLTSLPLMFGEDFSLEGVGSPALRALEQRYRVTPISVADASILRGGGLLLMAHPLAQPGEALVELDRWVRSGGRLLLLADPMLEWPSERPLGDRLRAPPAFADTGLLRHWGLILHAPDERGPREEQVGRFRVLTVSPGALEGRCAVEPSRVVARCRVGHGQVTVIADADFLNIDQLDGATRHNLDALLSELAALESLPAPDSASTEISTGGERRNN